MVHNVADWLHERGVERGDPTSVLDSYTQKRRQILVEQLRPHPADSNLNNSEPRL